MLAVTVMCGTVMGSYEEAQAMAPALGIGALEIIEGILLSFGISVMTSEMIGTLTKDPDAAKQEEWNEIQAAFWQDQLEAQYEAARKKKMEAPSPTPEPDDDNKDKAIPTFKELMQKYKDTGKIVLGSAAGYGVWDCMKEAVGKLWDSLVYNHDKINGYTIDDFDQLYADSLGMYQTFNGSDRYCVAFLEPNDNIIGFRIEGTSSTNTKIYPIYKTSYSGSTDIFMYCYYFPAKYSSRNGRYVNSGAFDYYASNQLLFYNFNVPLYDSNNNLINLQKKEDIWVHPDLQGTYQNNGKLKYPQEAPQPLNVPSIDQLAELATKLSPDTNPSYDPSMTPEYVAELIKQLQATETPDPQPTTKPDVNPTLAPNPTGSPTGTPTDPTPEEEASPYKADLREIFPFCIPFDLIHLFKVFDAEPEAPVFKFPLDLELDNPWTDEKVVDYHHEFEFDFSDYEDLIKLLRIIQIVAFITGLMMITRQQMIKG